QQRRTKGKTAVRGQRRRIDEINSPRPLSEAETEIASPRPPSNLHGMSRTVSMIPGTL
ncbi:hypothetical protein KIPB_017188, partial [Kipferlia bialata]